MCDYSLQNIASRLAKVGDKLVSAGFRGTVTHGFAAVGEPDVAICLLPGTEIAFDQYVQYDGYFRRKRTSQKTAIFRQVDQPWLHAFHDAIELADGQVVLLTRLCEGQHATVLQLPANLQTAQQAREPRRMSLTD